jgi:M6 family metalloprotease-like protein
MYETNPADPIRPGAKLQPDGLEYVLVLRVDFPDQPGKRSRAELDSFLFDTNRVSLASYYAEVSYGKMRVEGGPSNASYPRLDGWYRMPQTMRTYGSGRYVVEQYQRLVQDACNAADGDVDFRDFDRDADGVLDHLIILHAGNDEASSGVSDDLWSILVPSVDRLWDGVRVESAMVIGEEPGFKAPHFGVWFHEFLHDFGAPETYVIGTLVSEHDQQYCLMGIIGPYQGNGGERDGSQPAHICGYLKWDIDGDPDNGRRGWITPIELDATTLNVIVSAFAKPDGHDPVYKVDVPGKRGKEFFLIENRNRSAGRYDSDLPDDGLVIWHVDENANRATFSIANRLWVEDPGDPLHRNLTVDITADAAYSADDGQTAFTPSSSPNSNANDGSPTGISVMNVSASGPLMTFDLFLGDTFEPNDTRETAALVSFDRPYDSFLYDANDVHDLYAFDVAAGDRFRVRIVYDGTNGLLRADLRDENGKVISSSRVVELATGQAAVDVLYRATSTGRFFLDVTTTTRPTKPIAYSFTITRDTAIPNAPPRFVTVDVVPNPVPVGRPIALRVAFEDAGVEDVRAELFDIAGHRVALTAPVVDLATGDATMEFRADSATAFAPGVYLALVTASRNGQTAKRMVKVAVE